MYGHIIVRKENGIVTITLNDPDRRNAQSVPMGREFQDAIRNLKQDPEARVLIVTGAGRAFCAGGDLDLLEGMLGGNAEDNRRQMLTFYRYFLSVTELEIPTIAAINGAAIGAGLSFALGCDLRLAAQEAKLGFTYANLGLHPGMGTHFLLPRLIGTAKAYELVATGKIIDGREAERIGLVNAAVPAAEVMPAAQRLAETLRAQPAGTLRTSKQVMYAGLRDGLSASLEMDAMGQSMSFTSPEMRERLQAAKGKA